MSLSCRFLQIKEVNQKFPQMTLIRLKTRHFHTKKNIWCWYKIANISRLCYCRMSNLTICRLTSNNFNYSLLMAPSFANGGNLFVLLIFFFDGVTRFVSWIRDLIYNKNHFAKFFNSSLSWALLPIQCEASYDPPARWNHLSVINRVVIQYHCMR